MDKEKIDAIFRLGIMLAVLLAATSIAYYFVFYLPDRDAKQDARQEANRLDLLAKEDAKKAERATNYQACTNRAEINYSANWAAACRSQAIRSEDGYKNCIRQPYETDPTCRSIWPQDSPAPDCTLHGVQGEKLNAGLEADKNRCLKEAQNDMAVPAEDFTPDQPGTPQKYTLEPPAAASQEKVPDWAQPATK